MACCTLSIKPAFVRSLKERSRLAVEADDLLIPGHNAGLARRGPDRGRPGRHACRCPVVGPPAADACPGSSAPASPHSLTSAPRAARQAATFAAPPSLNSSRSVSKTGHGCFGRNTFQRAVQVGIEHGVADDRNPPARHGVEQVTGFARLGLGHFVVHAARASLIKLSWT